MTWPIGVKRVRDSAKLPFRAHDGDAGADLFAVSWSTVWPGQTSWIETGIAVDIPKGFVGLIHPRSGLAFKNGITVLNAPGTIDAGYTGEIKVSLHNTSDEDFEVWPGDRIAQLVIQRVELPHFNWVAELEDSQRGVGGFGSTGVK